MLGRLARCRRGIAATEFALIAPAIILFLMGVIDLGRYLWLKANVQYAVSETARWTYLNINASNTSANNLNAKSCIVGTVKDYLSGIDDVATYDIDFSALACPGSANTATITVNYAFQSMFGNWLPWTVTTSSVAVTPLQCTDPPAALPNNASATPCVK